MLLCSYDITQGRQELSVAEARKYNSQGSQELCILFQLPVLGHRGTSHAECHMLKLDSLRLFSALPNFRFGTTLSIRSTTVARFASTFSDSSCFPHQELLQPSISLSALIYIQAAAKKAYSVHFMTQTMNESLVMVDECS